MVGKYSGPDASKCYSWSKSCSAGSVFSTSLPSISQLSNAGKSSMLAIFATYLTTSSYSGPIFNIRRSSDNVNTTFYADSIGNLGTLPGAAGTPFTSWIGLDVAYITVWYDQSGRKNHAKQSNTKLQPTFTFSPSRALFVDFTGNKTMSLPGSVLPSGNGVYTIVAKHGSYMGNGGLFGIGQPGPCTNDQSLRINGGGYGDEWNCNYVPFGSPAAGNIVALTYDQSNRRGYVNNAQIKATASSSRAFNTSWKAVLGSTPSLNYFGGQLNSLITASTVLATADRSLLEGCTLCPAGTYQPSIASSQSSCLTCPSGSIVSFVAVSIIRPQFFPPLLVSSSRAVFFSRSIVVLFVGNYVQRWVRSITSFSVAVVACRPGLNIDNLFHLFDEKRVRWATAQAPTQHRWPDIGFLR